ncbi:hypothetical protein HBI56_156270 [Parastagonospora nodorum]|nr:hypothetical protein HBH53_070530 [Parastagonospora nodorum]KAH3974061.1 hypothetical protein HBH52_141300 [Parastagonospora nodorum]KAH4104510.1 hypothetical protein HBH46_102460 [Parastagonospora nodorum]KAH4160233.1 hypothetical protein HBH43_176830 [Parastagonospora nodorum]KAH4185898.1 hypothetical protein HBH42_169390 [Parastagonospora nodorum]
MMNAKSRNLRAVSGRRANEVHVSHQPCGDYTSFLRPFLKGARCDKKLLDPKQCHSYTIRVVDGE